MKHIVTSLILLFSICTCTLTAQQKTVYLAGVNHNTNPNSTTIIDWTTSSGGTTQNINYQGVNPTIHNAVISSINTLGNTCNSFFLPNFQGSFDNVNFNNIPTYTSDAQQTGVGTNVRRSIQASGSFPFIRLSILAPDITNCKYTANYAGTSYQGILSGPSDWGDFRNMKTVQVVANQIGTFVIANDTANRFIAVYGYTICNKTATQDFQFLTDAFNTYSIAENMQAGQCIVAPISNIPYFTTIPQGSNSLSYAITKATDIAIFLQYKFE